MITEFKLFEYCSDIPKVGDYFVINYIKQFKSKIIIVEDYYNVHRCIFIFMDSRNKFHTTPKWVVVSPKELIRKMTPEEIEDFEYKLSVNNYNL